MILDAIKVYREPFVDVYEMIKTVYPPRNTEEFANFMASVGNNVCKKYENDPRKSFVCDLTLCIFKEMQRVAQRGANNAKDKT